MGDGELDKIAGLAGISFLGDIGLFPNRNSFGAAISLVIQHIFYFYTSSLFLVFAGGYPARNLFRFVAACSSNTYFRNTTCNSLEALLHATKYPAGCVPLRGSAPTYMYLIKVPVLINYY